MEAPDTLESIKYKQHITMAANPNSNLFFDFPDPTPWFEFDAAVPAATKASANKKGKRLGGMRFGFNRGGGSSKKAEVGGGDPRRPQHQVRPPTDGSSSSISSSSISIIITSSSDATLPGTGTPPPPPRATTA